MHHITWSSQKINGIVHLQTKIKISTITSLYNVIIIYYLIFCLVQLFRLNFITYCRFQSSLWKFCRHCCNSIKDYNYIVTTSQQEGGSPSNKNIFRFSFLPLVNIISERHVIIHVFIFTLTSAVATIPALYRKF